MGEASGYEVCWVQAVRNLLCLIEHEESLWPFAGLFAVSADCLAGRVSLPPAVSLPPSAHF